MFSHFTTLCMKGLILEPKFENDPSVSASQSSLGAISF